MILNRLRRSSYLIDVHFSNHLSFRVHINSLISAANESIYLMKLLSAQGLNDFGLSVVFNPLMLSKMLYASQALGAH
jgi:hypothetical protein